MEILIFSFDLEISNVLLFWKLKGALNVIFLSKAKFEVSGRSWIECKIHSFVKDGIKKGQNIWEILVKISICKLWLCWKYFEKKLINFIFYRFPYSFWSKTCFIGLKTKINQPYNIFTSLVWAILSLTSLTIVNIAIVIATLLQQ